MLSASVDLRFEDARIVAGRGRRVGATSASRRTDALGQAPNPLIELGGRERAERQGGGGARRRGGGGPAHRLQPGRRRVRQRGSVGALRPPLAPRWCSSQGEA